MFYVSKESNFIRYYPKRTNEADVDIAVLDKLIERSELFPSHIKYYYIFAKHEFTKRCIEKAASLENVTLVRFLDMI